MSKIRLLVAWVTLLVVGTDLFVVSPMLVPWSRQFGVGVETMGFAVTGFSVAYVASAPFVGRWADRRGRRRALTVAMVLFAAANLLTASAVDPVMLIAVRVVAGVAAAGITPAVFALVGGAAVPTRRAWALGVATSGLLSALWLGAPAGELLSQWIGWRGVFAGLVAVTLVMLVANRLCWPADEATGPAGDRAPAGSLRVKAAAVLPTALWAIAVYGVYTYLASGLHLEGGRSGAAISADLATYGVCAVLSSIVGGRFADARRPRTVVVAALLGTGVALVVLGLLLTGPDAVVAAALGAFALAAYLVFPAQQAELLRRFEQERSTVLAWNQSAMYVGIAAGSAFGGLVTTHWGFGVLPFCCAAFAALGALVARGVHRPEPAAVRAEQATADRTA